jgi:molecular chaperone HtpG
LPGWLRFVRLVVDSADLPLNVSREMIQQSAVFVAIRKGVTNRMVQELTKLAEGEPERYAKIWESFGAVLKEGLYEDPERRDALFKLARFATTTNPAGDRTLADYVAGLRENQTAIYYLTGEDAKRLAASPQLEGFRARDVEVLLLADPVDAFWVSSAVGYEGKPFKSVSQGAADIKAIALKDGAAAAEASPEVATLIAFFKQTLDSEIAEARASDRLTDSLACLVAPDFAPDRQLEKILAAHGRLGERAKAVLEINASHPLVVALAKKFAAGPDKALVEDAAWLIYEEARLADGDALSDAPAFAGRLRRVLEKAFA